LREAKGEVIDVQPLCKALFLDRSTEFVFGESANLLGSESNCESGRLARGFDEALMGMFKRYMLGRFKFLVSKGKWLETCGEVHGIIDGYIQEEIERQKNVGAETEGDGTHNYVLLRELVKLTDDRLFIRNELMNIFFPARDTAGILTGNILFLLARHPDAWEKMRKEVLEIGEQDITFELLKSLKYVHGVINESMCTNTHSNPLLTQIPSTPPSIPHRWFLEDLPGTLHPSPRWRPSRQRPHLARER
jgi:hypothetical protein